MRIPGVGVRPDLLLREDRYRILLNDVPYAEGTIPADSRLVIGRTGNRDGITVRNPWSGQPAAWSAGADDAGLALHEAVAWVLEGVLRINLRQFVTLPEVEHQLDAWQAGGGSERSELVAKAVRRRSDKTRLVAVINRLVREQVPVNELGIIIEVFAGMRDTLSVTRVADEVRAKLVRVLPGSAADREAVDVPGAVEDIVCESPRPIPRDKADQVLALLRETIGARAPGQFVLVVQRSGSRAPVQCLSERLLPSVAVVSAAERLSTAREPQIAG